MEKTGGALTEPTAPERLLRDALSADALEFEFQFPTKTGFILDFAFLKERLAVEVDGPTHYTDAGKRKDRFRDWMLKREGWHVLHVHWQRIEHELPKTVRRIRRELTRDSVS